MAKKAGKLASRYAKALLSAVIKEFGNTGSPTAAQKESATLSEFATIWTNERSLSLSIQNPMFEKGERMNALTEVAKKAGMSDVLVRFLRVVFERDRIGQLAQIAAAFAELADASASLLQVEVITARNVSGDEKGKIEQSLAAQLLAAKTGGKLNFTWKEDAAILGGLVVRYGGKVLDGSLSGKLARLESRLKAAV